MPKLTLRQQQELQLHSTCMRIVRRRPAARALEKRGLILIKTRASGVQMGRLTLEGAELKKALGGEVCPCKI